MHCFTLFILLTAGAFQDLRERKISNRLIVSGLLCYPVTAWLPFIRGPSFVPAQLLKSCLWFYLSFVLTICVFFFLFLFRMTGAGDIKLFGLIIGYLGFRDGSLVILLGLAASAVWSLFFMLHRRALPERFHYFKTYFCRLFITGVMLPYYERTRDGTQVSFCLIPFLWWGFVVWLAMQGGVQ